MFTNGRVAFFNDTSIIPSQAMRGLIAPTRSSPYTHALEGGWSKSELSCQFFSAANVDLLQKALVEGVQKRSNGQYLIGFQNEDELKTIMRSIFLQYAKNNSYNISAQINTLNQLVLDYAVGQVFGEAQGYVAYLRDAGTMYSNGAALLPNPRAPDSDCKELEFKQRGV